MFRTLENILPIDGSLPSHGEACTNSKSPYIEDITGGEISIFSSSGENNYI